MNWKRKSCLRIIRAREKPKRIVELEPSRRRLTEGGSDRRSVVTLSRAADASRKIKAPYYRFSSFRNVESGRVLITSAGSNQPRRA